MNLSEYELHGRHAYEDLAKTIARIVDTITKDAVDFRVQQVQARAKGVKSLHAKLTDRDALESETIESVVKDLAGCRAILYTNADVERFISTGLISDNFEVDWSRTKFHYPMSEPTAQDGFISYNYVVQLKADRLALPEYSRFSGMACEVQVQTTLDHAWSEMAHDTIYKPPPAGFGSAVMKSVEERMTSIIQEHLRPAGFEFQKVAADVRSLEKARALFESDPLKLLAESPDNNERHALLKQIEERLVPYYDDLPAQAPALRAAMLSAAKQARATLTKPWIAMEHSFPGVEADRVVDQALEIVDDLRFTAPEAIDATFDVLAELFVEAGAVERERIFKSVERLAKHDLAIWQSAGPLVEARLVEHIEALDSTAREPIRSLLVKVLHFVLEPDVSGTTSTYNTITLHQGAVRATAEYLDLRRRAIAILKDLLQSSGNEAEQRQILQALSAAGRLPGRGQLTAELFAATLSDSIDVVSFAKRIARQLPFEVLQAFEHDLLWRYRRNRTLAPYFNGDAALESQRSELQDAILAFRDHLNSDEAFVIYKTLVGFESVFPPEWDGDGMDFQAEQTYRAGEIKRRVGEVSEESFDKWLAAIRRCAQTKSNDGATFPSFRSFLAELGKEKPTLLVRLFDSLDEDLDWFVGSMLQGLEAGPLETEIDRRIRAWLGEGKHLLQILHYFNVAKTLDAPLLRQASKAAIKADDERAISFAMEIALKRHDEVAGGLVDVFEAGQAHLANKRSTRWVQSVWYHTHQTDFLTKLPEATRDRILANLVYAPQIDTHDEEVLNAVAGTEPMKLLRLLHERLNLQVGDEFDSYEALPYEFHRLGDAFGAIPSEIVEALRQWFDEDDNLFEFRAGSLPAKLFPTFEGVDVPFRELAQSGSTRDLEFVLAALRGYEGEAFLHPICQDIVDRLEGDDPLLRQVDFALDESGMLSGEFGLVELYQRRKSELEGWLSDDRQRVREFAERRRQQLDLRIAAEQRRSLEGLELHKRRYGE